MLHMPLQANAATPEARKLAFDIVGMLQPDSSLIYNDDLVLKIFHQQRTIPRSVRKKHEQAFLAEFRRFVDPGLKRWIDGLFYESMAATMSESQLSYMQKLAAQPRYQPVLRAIMSTAFRGDAANDDIEQAMQDLSAEERHHIGKVMASQAGHAWYAFVQDASNRYLQTGKSTILSILKPNLEHVLLKYIRLYRQ